MGGREGLIDRAVKTAETGTLVLVALGFLYRLTKASKLQGHKVVALVPVVKTFMKSQLQ